MYAVADGILKRRLLTILSACLILPLAFTGQVGRASPASQTPTPTPTPAPSKPILLTDPVPDPHQDGVMYFSETGHTLRGKFLDYWQSNGGLAQFGYPLTEEFFEPDGPNNSLVQVQYFERNRFELHPENQPPNDVLLGTLGLEFHRQDPPTSRELSPAIYFPPTGHNLSGVFLQYWQAHGGLAVNGYPISEPQTEQSANGKQYLTQWFERARYELHPENANTPYEVLLGQLGRQLSEKRGYPYGWYPPFGHAPDYSWVSGEIWMRIPFSADGGVAGCSILRYDLNIKETRGHSETDVQLDGPSWPLSIVSPVPPYEGDFVVVFGRHAYDSERYIHCVIDPAPGYILDKWQGNPAQ
jgi:hypothetical protein